MTEDTITFTLTHGNAMALANLLQREAARIDALKRPRRAYRADNILRREFVAAYAQADAK